ncbi:hypothetical protein [Amycolatopsis sp. cg9]|uniref:hypothetical protein n=1 Tax=Amycolatopsis sp. cg9 TaxID=3238801 RepID=UPI003526244F
MVIVAPPQRIVSPDAVALASVPWETGAPPANRTSSPGCSTSGICSVSGGSGSSFNASWAEESPDAFWLAYSTGCAQIGLAGFRNHVMPWCSAAVSSPRRAGSASACRRLARVFAR